MAIAQKLAGYSLGQADLLRRAMGKKKKAELDKQFEAFSAGHDRARLLDGRGQDAVGHPAAVLRLRVQQGALRRLRAGVLLDGLPQGQLPGRVHGRRCSRPIKDDKDKTAIYLNECRRMGIKVLPPDVNESEANFTPVGTDIRFGLTAIRNVGSNVVDAIVTARREQGRYTDFGDFMDKVDTLVCNKRVIESLIKAGAFDSLGHRRRALVDDPRGGRRPVRRHQAQRGDRPGLALRRRSTTRRRGRLRA